AVPRQALVWDWIGPSSPPLEPHAVASPMDPALPEDRRDIGDAAPQSSADEVGPERHPDGDATAEPPRRPPRTRWAWTLIFAVLVPVGALLMVAGGGPYGDHVLRIIGGALLVGAVVIALWLLAGGEGDEAPPD